MAAFKKTNVKVFTKLQPEITTEAAYWKRLGAPSTLKEFAGINYIDFSPHEPFHFAATCSVRVQIYNPVTKNVHKSLNRFRETAYGGKFRHDGKLLCAGEHGGQVKLFDVNSKNLLRVFQGHTGPVQRCFFTSDGTHLLSCSDDRSVALWDMPSETAVFKYDDFTDYVRAGAVSPVSPDLVLAGCYDRKVVLLDCRTKTPALEVEHGSPGVHVESVLFSPTGGLFITAGGTEVCIWDALAGGRLLARLSPHHKAVMCLALASNGSRLLSGGLDRRVRVIDMVSMQPIHALDFPSPVLSLGVSPGDEVLAVGMTDGLISISRREEIEPVRPRPSKISRPPGRRLPVEPRDLEIPQDAKDIDILIKEEVLQTFTNSDKHLRSFRYSKALDVALSKISMKKRPETVVAFFQELLRRKGLHIALAGREESSLVNILKFISKYIGEFEFTPTLVDVTNIFLEVYEDQLASMPEVARLCEVLQQQLLEEEKLTQSLLELQGALQMLGAAASCTLSTEIPLVDIEPSTGVTDSFPEVKLS